MDRRSFLRSVAGTATTLAFSPKGPRTPDLSPVFAQIEKRHDENIDRLREWIRRPSIAAENRSMSEGSDLLIRFLREAGFDRAIGVPTEGHPGVFATLDAGAARTVGLYFMYDVKQAEPSEWSTSPWEATLVDKPGLGKIIVGRGAVNQKGPEAALLAALVAFRAAGRKPPVNLVLVAEGEEEIGSPHFEQIVHRPDIQLALSRCLGVFMPMAGQGLDGVVTIMLGSKGVVELELICTGERWGRGPRRDIHSSNKARVDSPAWHLIKALSTLVSDNGNDSTIDGFRDKARPISTAEKAMVAEAATRLDEDLAKKQTAVDHWINDVGWTESLERLISEPTVNIEGLVAGYTGSGGKTILPHAAAAKLDLRLVPDMKAVEVVSAVKEHLAKRGFGDIEVRVSGGYDPTSTSPDAALVRAQFSVYQRGGVKPVLWPRNAGSWPGYVFTGNPLRIPAGYFGLGHGGGAHAPDEYYVVESIVPQIAGFDAAAGSFVDYLSELATIRI